MGGDIVVDFAAKCVSVFYEQQVTSQGVLEFREDRPGCHLPPATSWLCDPRNIMKVF